MSEKVSIQCYLNTKKTHSLAIESTHIVLLRMPNSVCDNGCPPWPFSSTENRNQLQSEDQGIFQRDVMSSYLSNKRAFLSIARMPSAPICAFSSAVNPIQTNLQRPHLLSGLHSSAATFNVKMSLCQDLFF
jgi:hypothetical protein